MLKNKKWFWKAFHHKKLQKIKILNLVIINDIWYFLTLQFFNQLLLFFFSIYRPKITNLFWLDNDVQLTSKRRRFLAIFLILKWF